jgi:molecular chaperone GrpE
MNKEELKTKIENLVKDKLKGEVSFPQINEPTFLKAIITVYENLEKDDVIKNLESEDYNKWKSLYFEEVSGNGEKNNKKTFLVDFLSSEYLDGWRRAKADLLNYQKEEKERMTEIIKFSNEKILSDLVNVLDSFDLGIAAISDQEVKKGILLIKSQMEDILKRYGLEKIESRKGEMFNPELEEVVELKESELEEGKIIDILTPGYKLNNKILRPVRVVVSKGQINKNN